MGKPAVTIELTDEQRAVLEGLVRRRQTAQGLARRAEIVLLAADGLPNKEIVVRPGKNANTVGKWRRRFAEHGLTQQSAIKSTFLIDFVDRICYDFL